MFRTGATIHMSIAGYYMLSEDRDLRAIVRQNLKKKISAASQRALTSEIYPNTKRACTLALTVTNLNARLHRRIFSAKK